MISSAMPFESSLSRITLHAADRGNFTLDRFFERYSGPIARIYNTSSLFIHVHLTAVISGRYWEGMKLLFSFHHTSRMPESISNETLWNCSVPYKFDFLFHLSCNLGVDCNDASDEGDCEYTTEVCGPRYVTLGGSCFVYLRLENEISWNQALDVCKQRKLRLASLGTADKWNEAVRLLPSITSRVRRYFIGAQYAKYDYQNWYKYMHSWLDGTTIFHSHRDSSYSSGTCEKSCGNMKVDTVGYVKMVSIDLDQPCYTLTSDPAGVLCEKELRKPHLRRVQINGTSHWPKDDAYIECPLGRHYTHRSLACDVRTSCWSPDQYPSCTSFFTHHPPPFQCANGVEHVLVMLVCDLRADCSDRSDEAFCDVPSCEAGLIECSNKKCIPSKKMCDVWRDCPDGNDEDRCTLFKDMPVTYPPPGLVSLRNDGHLQVVPFNITPTTALESLCPETHFQCMDNGFCLPVFLRCNGMFDCPDHEDEVDCAQCPGYYRCLDSTICVHYSNLCDHHYHCRHGDDEYMCDATCPPSCQCHGLAYFCRDAFHSSLYPDVRFLDASDTAMTPARLSGSQWLVHLILAKCGLTHLDQFMLPNLFCLELQDNRLSNLTSAHFKGTPNLRELCIAGNPLSFSFEQDEKHKSLSNLVQLNLSRVQQFVFDVTNFTALTDLQVLNLSQCGVERVSGEGFRYFHQLREIDLRGCPMRGLGRVMFQDMNSLRFVYADNFKMCCFVMLPENFNRHNCFARSDEISSCDNLLHGNVYSVCVFILSTLAFVGNTVSFIFRTYVSKRESKLGYGNFVTHLSVSDLLMGIYLAIIGVVDRVYHGAYVWNDEVWRHSGVCKFAGFLSLLSSEVSALIMCLITLDRFIVLTFPFSQLRFNSSTAHAASALIWAVGILLASVPLLPVTSHWEFYSQTGICIPLPITRAEFAGQGYSFSILVVFNFIVFVCISLGQLSIYWSVRANSLSGCSSTKKTKDLTIARRLITVAMTDFLCWFPIGVLGLLASRGFPIPSEVNVIVAIFVLPLNSAINPCLYTVNVILERRSRAREERLRAFLLAQVKAQN